MTNYISPAEAVKLIKSGDNVYIQGSTSVPETLIEALTARHSELRGVKLYSAFAIGKGPAPYCQAEYRDIFEVNSFFMSSNIRHGQKLGCVQFIPSLLGEIPAYFRQGRIKLDAVLINVSMPDEHGYCSYGVSVDATKAAVDTARLIIAQVNRYMPRTFGDGVIHISEFAAVVEGHDPVVELPPVVSSEVDLKIGQNIADLIPDGATLQIGVGGIPNAVLNALGGHKHLGLHTEAMTEGVLPLLEKGIIDNSLKKIYPGKCVASLALGTRKLYDFMDNNPSVLMRDVAWTNDPFIIRQNPKVMAVNSAIEVDLSGQICADSIGTSIFSGVGGQHDFMYGGALSEGGKIFIALPSITAKGQSKISSVLAPGAGVVTTRAQAQYIVTEYGVAELKGKNLAERARALINIAHPSAREALERDAAERLGYGFLRLK